MRAPAFWTIRHGRDAAPMIRTLLTPFGWLYGASVARRRAVISLGNLTAGGTGKTPLARLIRAELTRMMDNAPVAILSGGYGGSVEGPERVDTTVHIAADVGDEPMMLAADGDVYISHDRVAGGLFIAKTHMKAIVLDDAHQNPGLHKDLSIVVVDGETGFGNGRMIPAGPLREPVAQGLARADLVITMGHVSEDTREDLAGYTGPILAADLVANPTIISGKVLGFCGIGRPEKFDATLRGLGLEVVDMYPFPDHHPYSLDDMTRLDKLAHETGATLVTTEKDFVRIPFGTTAKVRVITVTAVMHDQAALRASLALALDRASARA
jgi:tetraacyldisaccharide 4'-kinase